MCLVEGTYHAIHSVVMVLFLVQRNVRERGWDVMGMSVNVGWDGQGWGMCHVWECVGMGYWCRVRSVKGVGQDVGMDVDVELDGMCLVEGTSHVIHSVVMELLLTQRSVRWEGTDVMRHAIVVMVGIKIMMMVHVCLYVGMGLLLVQKNVSWEGVDAIMNVNARMDGNL